LLSPWTHTPYGYRVDPDRPRDPAGVSPDEAKAAVIAEIFAMYLEQGVSLFGVSRHLQALGIPAPRGGKVWSVATLRGILTNPVYAGKVYAGRVRYRPAKIRRSATHPIGHPHDSAVPLAPEEWIPVASVPAVVSQEQFDLAGEKLSRNKSFARRNNKAHNYLLRALVSCGRCKLCSIARTQTGRKANNRKQRYYVCSGKFKQAQSGLEENCPSRYAPADQLDELVWKDLCEVLTHPKSITDALERAHGGHWLPQELQARQQNLREGRGALNRQLDRLTDAYLGEVVPLAEYERRRRDLEQRDEALAGQERQLEAQADQRIELAGVAGSVEEFCERVRSGLADATFEQRRELVELLVDRVIVTDEEVEIRYVVPTDPSSEKVRFCHLRSDYLDHPNLGVALPEQGFVEHLTAYVDVGQEPTELVLPVLIKLQPHPLALELRLGEAASLRSVGLDVLRGVHGLWGVHADEPDVLDAAYGGRYLDGVAVYDPRHRGRRFVLLRPCCSCQIPT
jgi:site-specific DNA recombinase